MQGILQNKRQKKRSRMRGKKQQNQNKQKRSQQAHPHTQKIYKNRLHESHEDVATVHM